MNRPARSILSLAATTILATLLASQPAMAVGDGFLVPAPASDNVKKNPKYDCPETPAPVVSLNVQSKYDQSDVHHANIDKDAEERYSKAIEPVREYGKNLVKISNAYVRSNPRNPAAAACALSWMSAWAQAGAMTDMQSKQATLNQGQAVGGYALAYLQIRNAPGLPEAQKKAVEAWLNKLGHQTMDSMEKNDGNSGKNNHRYWNGLSAIAAGIASSDKQLIEWGADSARLGIRQIGMDGTMPIEMSRGKRARDYHNFAAEPLVAIAELAETQGIDLYAENGHAIERLVKLVVQSFTDPSFFEKATGIPQEPYPDDGTVPSSRIGWLEIYNKRFPSPANEAVLKAKRPVASSGLGGNTTLLFHGESE